MINNTNNTKISCRGVSKEFVQKGNQLVRVLDKIDLDVRDNEFLVLLGPGQSGKSTLARIMAGLETPTTGAVTLNGKEVTGPGKDRGMVFQSYMLFPWRTVMGNVALGPRVNGASRKNAQKIAKHYIDLVGLNGFEKAFPHQLSGGMKQRVGIARAYANKPEIMFLDEPFGQLDAQTRIVMAQEIIRIWNAEKRTVIFVTNNIEEALFLGERIVTLEDKLPSAQGKIYDVSLPRPRNYTSPDFLEMRRIITEGTKLVL